MTDTITRAHVCRFHEHVSLSLTDKHGDDLGTIYIPREMLLVLRDMLEQAHRDISTKQFSASTFKPRTVLANGEVLWS